MYPSKRIIQLDGLRGVAVLWILSMHLLLPVAMAFKADYFCSLLDTGWAAVDLFFVLSGFLITRILISEDKERDYFLSFYYRRALRILPVLYLFLFSVLCLYGIAYFLQSKGLVKVNGPFPREEIQSVFLFYTNFLIARKESYIAPFLNPFWSLSVEEHFYLLWPLLTYFCSQRGLKIACLAIFCLSPLLRAVFHWNGVSALPISVMSFSRWDGFSVGALLAISENKFSLPYKSKIFSEKIVHWLIPASLGILVVMNVEWRLDLVFGLKYTALALGFGGIIFTLIRQQKGSVLYTILTHPILLFTGKISYALYIVHMAVNMVVVRLNPGEIFTGIESPHQKINLLINTISIFVLSYGIATFSFYCLEQPLQRLFRNKTSSYSNTGLSMLLL